MNPRYAENYRHKMIEGQGHHTFTKIIAIVPVIILLFLKGDICIIAILCPPLAGGTLNSNYTNVPPGHGITHPLFKRTIII